MTREEFSDQLIELRKVDACSKCELSRRTSFPLYVLSRIENARNNYSVKNALHAITKANGKLILNYDDVCMSISEYDQLASEIKNIRRYRKMSQNELSEKSGITRFSLMDGEKLITVFHIDTLLSILTALDVELKIIHND